MRRILLVLTVAVVMAALMAVTASSAFARPIVIIDPGFGKCNNPGLAQSADNRPADKPDCDGVVEA